MGDLMGDDDGRAAGRADAGDKQQPELQTLQRQLGGPLLLLVFLQSTMTAAMAVRPRLIGKQHDGQQHDQHHRCVDLESALPAIAGKQPFAERRQQHDTDAAAGVNHADGRSAIGRKPFRDQKNMRHHAGQGESGGEHEAEADIKLPQRRHLAAEKKPNNQSETAGNGNFPGAVTVK